MKRLFLIRHGQSEANIRPITSLREEDNWSSPLTDEGKSQAFELGKVFPYKIGVAYVSPFVRTIETYKEFMKGTGIKDFHNHFIDSRIRERVVLKHNGLYEELRQQVKSSTEKMYYYESQYVESMVAVNDRALSFLDHIRNTEYENNINIAIFSHGHFIHVLSTMLEQSIYNQRGEFLTPDRFGELPLLANCEYVAYTLHNGNNVSKYIHREIRTEQFGDFCTKRD